MASVKTISDFLIVDGKTYNVGVIAIKRKAPTLDKFAERTEDGVLHREVIGTYYNYEIRYGSSYEYPDDYDSLFESITSPAPFHTITVPYGRRDSHTYQAYCSSTEDEIAMIRNGETFWTGLKTNFIAQKPART